MAALYLHNALFIPESTNPARAQVQPQVHDLNSSPSPPISLPSPPPTTSRTRFPFSTHRRGGHSPPPTAFHSLPTSSPPSTPPLGLRQLPQPSHFQTASTSTIISTNAYEYSHPTEPLLQSTTSESVVYFDLLSRQPTHPHGPNRSQAWDMGLTLDGDPPTSRERKGLWERAVRRRLKRMKYIKWILETMLGVWAVYNSVRYFLAFTIYRSLDGQIASVVQGICTTLAIASFSSALVLDFFQPRLLVHHIRLRSIFFIRTFLVYISTFLLLGPAFVNFALLFAWRHHHDFETTPGSRCFVDIDLVWSPSASTTCKHPPWGVWLTLAIFRLIFTLIIVILYHFISFSYERLRHPSQHRPIQPHTDSIYGLTASGASPPMAGVSSSSVVIPQLHLHTTLPHHKHSDSTLISHAGSKSVTLTHQPSLLSNQLSRVSSAGSSTENGGSSEVQESTSSRPSNGSGSNTSGSTAVPITNSAGVVINSHPIASTSTAPPPPSMSTPVIVGESPGDLYGFADRFRTVVNQISRETDEGLEFGRSQNPMGYPTYDDLHNHSGEIQGDSEVDLDRYYHYSPPNLPPTLGFDEFGRPYPPEEPVRFLNSIIRRMPTIESLGSREVSSARSSFQQGSGGELAPSIRSVLTGSRPPTRSMSLTDHTSSTSEPSSRRNSLRTGAEMITSMGRTSEVGELMDVGVAGNGVGTSASGAAGGSGGVGRRGSLGSSNGHGTGGSYPPLQSTLTSRSTMTFYTAVSSSPSPSYSPILEQEGLTYSPVQTHAHSSLNSASGNSRTPTDESDS